MYLAGMKNMSPAMLALLTVALLAVICIVGILVLSVRGSEIPEWLKLTVGPLITLLLGWAAPSPVKGDK